jgi:hypothetical protein
MCGEGVAVAREGARAFQGRGEPADRGRGGSAQDGETVRHRSRVVAGPTRPTLRQVHLIHPERFAEAGLAPGPGGAR